jgi:hypothetical protein
MLLWATLLAGPVRLAAGLLGAETHLTKAEKKLSAGAIKDARFETLTAAAAARRARSGMQVGAPLLDLARELPEIGPALQEVDHLVGAAEHSAGAARGLLDVAQNALRGPDKIIVRTDDGDARILLDRVAEMGRTITRVRNDVRATKEELQAVALEALPQRLRPKIDDALDKASTSDVLLADVEAGLELLPDLLGADEQRTYLLAMQNSAEQRGTGGSILQFALLQIDNGAPHLAKGAAASVYVIDRARTPLDISLPEDAFYVREIDNRDAQRFGNANWSPDWPLSSKLTVAYAKAADARLRNVSLPRIDGTIGVDPIALRYLMPGAGPYVVEGAGHRITARTVVPLVLYRAYAAYPIPNVRRAVLREVVNGFYERAFNPAHPSELLRGTGAALARKHIQIWLADEAEQSFIERMDWDGAIRTAEGSDYLYVVEQNVGGNKLDYYSKQTTSVSVSFEGSDALVATEARVHNDVFLPQPRWSMGDSGPLHRPMLNVYVPGEAELQRAETKGTHLSSSGPTLARWPSEGRPAEHFEAGKRVWSATLEIPPGEKGAVHYVYRVPGVVREKAGRRTYRLVVQHQPKVRPELLSVSVALPGSAHDVDADGWDRRGNVILWERPLTKDVALEVSWRE